MYMKRKNRLLLKSLLTATALLLFSYIITNVGFELSGESDLIRKTNNLKSVLVTEESAIPDSILFVNICYEKELVDVFDKDGFLKGRTAITNRNALYEFLKLLSVRDDYKYILMDIFFNEEYTTQVDSLLFSQICKMDKIVIPKLRSKKLANASALDEKAGYSDYTTSLFGEGFNKYELIVGNEKSMVLAMYEDITGKSIVKKGPFYFDGLCLCNRTLFSKQQILFNSPYDKDGIKNYYHLTQDILEDPEGSMALFKGKYIFVGDLEQDDMHNTVQGRLPGCVITANIFLALMNGKHKIPVSAMLILFIVYFLFSCLVFSHHSISGLLVSLIEKRCPRLMSPFLVLILSWIGYSMILSIVCLCFYYTLYISYDIFLTATVLQWIDIFESRLFSHKKTR